MGIGPWIILFFDMTVLLMYVCKVRKFKKLSKNLNKTVFLYLVLFVYIS